MVLKSPFKTTYFVLAGLSYFVCFKPDDMYYGAAITVDVESLTRWASPTIVWSREFWKSFLKLPSLCLQVLVHFVTTYGISDTPIRKAHMIESLEMCQIIIHNILGEPKRKVQRMLDVPGDEYPNADHWCQQPLQEEQKWSPYVHRVVGQQAVVDNDNPANNRDEIPAVLAVPEIQPKKSPTRNPSRQMSQILPS